jgi:hypothetical protein
MDIQKEYVPLSAIQKNKWIRDFLAFNKVFSQLTFSTKWHINGKDICKNCWLKVTTVTTYKLKHYFHDKHAKSSTKIIFPKLSSIIAYLGIYFENICDKMPTNDKYHLPYFIFWNNILQELSSFLYKEEYQTFVIPSYFSVVKNVYFHFII